MVEAAGGSGGGSDGGGDEGKENRVCSQSGTFLGVANAQCVGDNISAALFLLGLIIVLSILLERIISWIRSSVECPQMRKIINRLFEELMVMGFISTIIFALTTGGLSSKLSDFKDGLTSVEELHFIEFFHYIVFLTMIYYVVIIWVLVLVGTVVPRYLWQHVPDLDDTEQGIRMSGEIIQSSSVAYHQIKKQQEKQRWTSKFNLSKRFHMWKSLEVLAYHLCRDRSRPIYMNSREMQRIFHVEVKHSENLTYKAYNRLCMRNMLSHISSMHWSAFIVLFSVVVLCSLFPEYADVIFIGIGVALLLLSTIIMFKTSRILQGIVTERLRIFTIKDVDRMVRNDRDSRRSGRRSKRNSWRREHAEKDEKVHDSNHELCLSIERNHPSLKAVALCIRAIIRMQMSALCHTGLHNHDHMFWFQSPWFHLRLFQLATMGQAFYLVWFSLVQASATLETKLGPLKLIVELCLPLLTLFVVVPPTLPSLSLILSLTGFFVEQNQPKERLFRKRNNQSTRDHMRRVRRSFQRSSQAQASRQVDESEVRSPGMYNEMATRRADWDFVAPSPSGELKSRESGVFLRLYDASSPSHLNRLNDVARSYHGDLDVPPTSEEPVILTPGAFQSTYVEMADDVGIDKRGEMTCSDIGGSSSLTQYTHLGKVEIDSPHGAVESDLPSSLQGYCSAFGGYADTSKVEKKTFV